MLWPFKQNKTSYDTGIWAEYYAALYLILKGYRPCALRYKTKSGEIDLIVKRGNKIVFVEVKYRAGEGDALESVRPQSQSRIRRAAEQYILGVNRESPRLGVDYRFDVIAIYNRFRIRHIINAF